MQTKKRRRHLSEEEARRQELELYADNPEVGKTLTHREELDVRFGSVQQSNGALKRLFVATAQKKKDKAARKTAGPGPRGARAKRSLADLPEQNDVRASLHLIIFVDARTLFWE